MNCIIVDDNKLARAAVKHLVAQVNFLELKEECATPIEAFNYLKIHDVDLVFLDIEMPGMTGLELIKNLEKKPIIILISSKKEYAVEAFELNVADYIVKPVTLPRFMIAVSRAKELFDIKNQKPDINEREKGFIFVRSHSTLAKIKVDDIIYIQALGDYVNVFTEKNHYAVHITLKGIEEKLNDKRFFRLHRSYLVATDSIDTIEENTAYIGKNQIPIGEQYKKDLLKRLNLI